MGDGMPRNWRTSTYSNGGGECVEVGGLPGGAAVRDSKDRAAGHLSFGSAQWADFLAALARGIPER